MKYHIVTFGCAANATDSERIAGYYHERGWTAASNTGDADEVVIVTCMIRQSAENRVYGLVHNLAKRKHNTGMPVIIVTGCMTGMAVRDTTGKMLKALKKKLPAVDAFTPIEEIGLAGLQRRSDPKHALVLISNGCNNFCSYCVVPYTRGGEISRPYDDIIAECKTLAGHGYTSFTLVGQNVNSYGADLIKNVKHKAQNLKRENIQPVYVKHLGKMRIPTLFPYLLADVCAIPGIKRVDFISSNPWDFSDDLINTIASNKKISRHIHLPVQSGDNEILKKMNRWYTKEEYLDLIRKLRRKIIGVTISTDIIVGFCGETEEQFQHTVKLCNTVGFSKAYVSMYSNRPMTVAYKTFPDDVPFPEKKRRWEFLDERINKTNLRKGTYK